MELRKTIVQEMKTLLNGNFRYGSFKSEPTVPYGNYARQESRNYMADDLVYQKINTYILRIVTSEKDFVLEDKIETMLDSNHISYQVITDEDVESQKAHCTEWEFTLCE